MGLIEPLATTANETRGNSVLNRGRALIGAFGALIVYRPGVIFFSRPIMVTYRSRETRHDYRTETFLSGRVINYAVARGS